MKELETELNLEHVLFLRDDLTEQRCEHVTTVLTISHCSGHSTQQTTGHSVFLLRKPVDINAAFAYDIIYACKRESLVWHCIYFCMFVYTHMCMQACRYVCTCTHECIYASMYAFIYAIVYNMLVCECERMELCMLHVITVYLCLHVCTCMHICIFACTMYTQLGMCVVFRHVLGVCLCRTSLCA